MGNYLNFGNKGFQQVLQSEIYVDKTGMIEFLNRRLDTEQRCLCVSRPRRFGKSVAAKMLTAYYCKECDSSGLFEGLGIAQMPDYREHLNKYNVIHVDMNDFLLPAKEMGDVAQTTDLFQQGVIGELKEKYQGVLAENESSLSAALAEIYNKTEEQFIFIIDEWDTLFREAKGHTKAQDRYIDVLRGLFKNLRASGFLKLAYLTGILPIKKYNIQSAMNNFDEFSMLQPGRMAEYMGFTEEETRALCERYQMEFQEAKDWYDGYSLSRVKHVYNPNSVVKAMLNGEYDTYWTRTETFESLRGYISLNFEGLKDDILLMLAGGRCYVDTYTFSNDMESFKNKDDVLTALIHLGYLAYDSERSEVFIPNEEIKREFQTAVRHAGWDTVVKAVQASDQLLRDVWKGNEAKVAEGIEKVHMENSPILRYNDENTLCSIITLAFYNAANEYTIMREMPSGKGFSDMVFIPKKFSDRPAMIIELKVGQSAENAIAQIKERRYDSMIKEEYDNLLLVGISYDGKTKVHECRIEKSTR